MDVTPQGMAVVTFTLLDALFTRLIDKGLHGNTHMPFADLNNEAVAALLAEFLAAKGLD